MKRRSKTRKNETRADYNFFNHLITFYHETIAKNGKFLKDNLHVVFHEYIHYYIQFNSLFFLEGFLHYFYTVSILMLNEKNIEKVPLLDPAGIINYDQLEKLFKKEIFEEEFYAQENWFNRSGHFYNQDDRSLENNLFRDFEIRGFDVVSNIIDLPWNMGQIPLPLIKLINPKTNYAGNFHFGEDTINEGIAEIIERFIAKQIGIDEEPHSFSGFPYAILPKLAQENNFNLFIYIVLADLSLQSPSPGYRFVQLIEKYDGILKLDFVNEELVATIKKIYKDELTSRPTIEYLSRLEDKLECTFIPFFEEMPIFMWLYKKFKYGIDRLKSGSLPIYVRPMFDSSDIEKVIEDIFSEFEPPLFLDKTTFRSKEYILASKANDMQERKEIVTCNIFYRALYDLYTNLMTGNNKFKCSNYKDCEYKFRDKECRIEPWKKAYVKDYCELGYAAKLLRYID